MLRQTGGLQGAVLRFTLCEPVHEKQFPFSLELLVFFRVCATQRDSGDMN